MKKRSAMSAKARPTSKDAGGSDAARASRAQQPPAAPEPLSAGDILLIPPQQARAALHGHALTAAPGAADRAPACLNLRTTSAMPDRPCR
jgi:hypothetical protein